MFSFSKNTSTPISFSFLTVVSVSTVFRANLETDLSIMFKDSFQIGPQKALFSHL
jgi:hypothetical protein